MIKKFISNKHSVLAFFYMLSVFTSSSFAQIISIDSAYKWTEQNYPLIKRAGIQINIRW